MNGPNEMTYGQRVRDAVMIKDTGTVKIEIKFPRPLFSRFAKWSLDNADDCFWLAIDKLLNDYEQKINIDNELRLLMDRDDLIATELRRVTERLDQLESKPETKPILKTFGRRAAEQVKGE